MTTRILFTLFILFPGLAWSCSCNHVSIRKGYKGADLIFTGTLLSSKAQLLTDTLGIKNGRYLLRSTRLVTFTFKAHHFYKGKSTTNTISLITTAGGADCGSNFLLNSKYLIYSYTTDGMLNDYREDYIKVTPFLTTNLCTRTKRDTFAAFYEKAVLRIL